MKKTLYISAFALMLVGTSFTSCSDFLEADNKTTANKTADDYLIDHPDELLMQAYASTYKFADAVDINEEGTDLYIPVRGKSASSFDQYTLNASNSDVYSYYKSIYTMINNANAVIHYNDQKIENPTFDAEAKFLRAWGYYLLTQQFGRVPYLTTYYKELSNSFPRTDLEIIYTSCIEELEAVVKAVEEDKEFSLSGKAGAPSIEAYKALLAKLYLSAAWDLDTEVTNEENGEYVINSKERFKKAAEWAAKAVGSTYGGDPATLALSFADKWSPDNENNKEAIWSILYNKAVGVANNLQYNYGNYYGECTATGLKNVGSTHAQSKKSLYLFAENDLRYEGTFMTTIHQYDKEVGEWPMTGYYAAYKNPTYQSVAYQYFPYYMTKTAVEKIFNENKNNYKWVDETKLKEDEKVHYNVAPQAYILDESNCVKFTFAEDGSFASEPYTYEALSTQVAGGICVKKFDDANSSKVKSNDCYRSVLVFHTSDLYLTLAEAYYMAGEVELALKYVNAVRNRSEAGELASFDASDYQKIYKYPAAQGGFNAIDIILDERARECYAERTRWTDLRRTKQLVRYNNKYNENLVGKVNVLRPIPTNEMSANTGITDQNPGY